MISWLRTRRPVRAGSVTIELSQRYRLKVYGSCYFIYPTSAPIAEDVFETERAADLVGARLARDAIADRRCRDPLDHLGLRVYHGDRGPSPLTGIYRSYVNWEEVRAAMKRAYCRR